MRVLLTGGGTAGHVYPALAVAAELVSEGRDEVLFVGTPRGVEARLVEEAGYPFRPMQARGLDRGAPLSAVPAAWDTTADRQRPSRSEPLHWPAHQCGA